MHTRNTCGRGSYTRPTAAKLLNRRRMALRPQREPETPQNGHGVPTLLLIEGAGSDHRTVREVLSEARGILDVDHVTTVKEGIARLGTKAVSAVLLDLTLPDVRNLSALDELRRVAPKV